MLKCKNISNKKLLIQLFICVSVGLLIMTGCGQSTPSVTPDNSPVTSPTSPVLVSPLSSPVETPTAQEIWVPGPQFSLEPLAEGDTHVTGQGPVGIPIVIVDVSLTGVELGSGFISAEGNFDIEVNTPLIKGHRIGIMAGATTPMTPEEAQEYIQQLEHWKGDGARNIPMHIGMLFETAMVE